MLDFSTYLIFLRSNGLSEFASEIAPVLEIALRELNNGDLSKWEKACASLPEIETSAINLGASAVSAEAAQHISQETLDALRENLMQLHPWRKGPFNLFSLHIDTEWRSDWKWDRLEKSISPLKGRRVLDVGCGNGYHCFRMVASGAQAVVGIDPFLLYVMQFLAVNKYFKCRSAAVLPLGIDDLPKSLPAFDSVFSMGVLYHRKDPLEHLEHLRSLLVDGGELVLETIIVEDEFGDILEPKGRHAKMRNVWKIPSPTTCADWLREVGFRDVRVVDISKTSLDEQRSSEWMTFESLGDFLDKDDTSLTLEGYPAPIRAVFVATK